MNYIHFDTQRYSPDPFTARRRGTAEWQSIGEWLGGNKEQRILEIGCGCGSLLLTLRDRGYTQCHGIDQDEALVRHGREILGMDIALGSWLKYLESSESIYDVIIALDVLEHFPREELHSLLLVIRAHLAPAGRVILRMPNALCPFVLPTLYGDLTHQFLMAPRTLEHLLRSAGFAGPVLIRETRPAGVVKRMLFSLVHHCFMKPLFGLAYYHFHGEFPSHLTPNLICSAHVTGC